MRLFIILLCSIYSFISHSQSWTKQSDIALDGFVSSFSIDPFSNLYIGFRDGRLLKLDQDGNELQLFSLANISAANLIEAQNSLRIFLFYFDNQLITILDRFSGVPKDYQLGDFINAVGMMACPSPEWNFWIAENNPQRLKKIDPLSKEVLVEVQTDLRSIRFMRTHKNLLIISDENGLHFFDLFGAKLRTITSLRDLPFFYVANDQLITTDGRHFIALDPYTGEILERLPLPLEDVNFAIRSKDDYLFLTEGRIHLFDLETE